MSEELLEITGTISIDETPGVQEDKDEIPVEEGEVLLAALYATYGSPANLSYREGMISTPDGFSTIGWADEEGASLDGVESNLMALDPDTGEYEKVILSTEDDGKVLIGTTESGNVAFIAVIVPSEDGLSSDVYLLGYLPMEHEESSNPDDFVALTGLYVHVTVEGTLDFEFDGAPSGNNDFMAFGEPDGVAIVVTGRTEGETVNSSKAGNEPTSLAANSNNINAGEGLVITYVSGMESDFLVPNLSGPEASDTANIQFEALHTSTEGSVTIVKVGPGNTTATVHITALHTDKELGTTFIPGIANDAVVEITAVYVNGIQVDLVKLPDSETVVITGIKNNDVITFETDGEHNRFVVENGGTGNARFNIGGVAIAGTETQSDAALASLLFYDDGPSVDDNPTVLLDDGALEGGNKEDPPIENTTGTLAHDFGADGAGSIEWLTSGAPAGFSYEADGDDLLIKQDDIVVLTLTLNPATGVYEVTQDNPVMHAPGDGENTQSFSVGYRVTDKDGDSIDGSLMIDVVDDIPTIVLSEDPAPTLTTDDSHIVDSTDPADFSVLFDVSFGADGQADGGGLSYSLSVLDPSSGLTDTLTGQAVMLALDEDGDIVGSITVEGEAVEVIRISVDTESGEVTLTQSRALVHPGINDPDDQVMLASGTIGLTATAMDADGDEVDSEPVDISGAFVFLDDEPEFERDIEGGLVAFLDGQTATDSGFLDYGNDGAKSFVITDYTELPNDTILGEVTAVLSADGTELIYSNADGELFRLTLDSANSYLFEVLQDAPLILNPLDFGSVTPGGPKELEIVQGELGSTTVVFDGFLSAYTADGDAKDAYNEPGANLPDDPDDDVNISNKGIGLKDNQMDPGEQLKFSVYEDFTADITKEVEGVQLVIDGGTGPNTTFSIRMVAYDSDGNLVAEEVFEDLALPKGNNTLVLEFLPGESFHEVYLFHDLESSNNGFRIKSISLFEREDVPDFTLETTVRATDGDGDFVDGSFVIDIGGSGGVEMTMEDSLL